MRKAIVSKAETAVLYLRMSDERQERSVGDQRTELVAYAEKHGYTIIREYVDQAISGDDTSRRIGFLRMREDAGKGEFAVVLCWDQDRFGRFDPIEGGHWILPFRNAGVRLETIAQGKIDWTDFAGRLIYLVQQEGKHAYLRDLSRNSIRGSIAKAKEGRGGDGSAPYGYRMLDGIRVIVPAEAEIVRRIFREYLAPSGSLRGIAERLNRDSIPSPTGKQWTSSTIRVILKNKKHTGSFVWGKQSKGRYFANDGGEIVSRRKGEGYGSPEPITHAKQFEAIIDERTFAKVQQLMEQRKLQTAPIRKGGGGFVFSGMLRCGHCGSVLSGQTAKRKAGPLRHYCCSGYHFGGKAKCSMNSIAEAPLVETVVRLIEERYLDDKHLERLRQEMRRQVAARHTETKADPARLEKQIADLDRQIDQGAERVFQAPAAIVDSLYAKLEQLRLERDRLNAELQAAQHTQDGSADQEEERIEEALRGLRKLRQAISTAEPSEVRTLLSSIVAKIELRFSKHQHGQYTRTTFETGTIFLRPDPVLCSNLATPGGGCNQVGTFSIRFTGKDLRPRKAG